MCVETQEKLALLNCRKWFSASLLDIHKRELLKLGFKRTRANSRAMYHLSGCTPLVYYMASGVLIKQSLRPVISGKVE